MVSVAQINDLLNRYKALEAAHDEALKRLDFYKNFVSPDRLNSAIANAYKHGFNDGQKAG